MARPKKDGVDYWPIDVDMFEDKKLRLIKGEFGLKGMFIALYIINEVYRTGGYYKVWDSDDSVLMSEAIGNGCTSKLVGEVLSRCCERSLFDKRVFDAFGVITSRGIQRRFVKITTVNRTNIPIIQEYLLLDVNDENDIAAGTLNKLAFKSISAGETPVFQSENTVKQPENATKQSKIKKSKSNESKAEHSKEKAGLVSDAVAGAHTEPHIPKAADAACKKDDFVLSDEAASGAADRQSDIGARKYAKAGLQRSKPAENDEYSVYQEFEKIKPLTASDLRRIDELAEKIWYSPSYCGNKGYSKKGRQKHRLC